MNDAGSPDPNGTHLRISGNNITAGNGPNTDDNGGGGIEVGGGKTFQLPAVDVTVTSGAVGTQIKPMLRVSDTNSGSYDSAANYLTFLQQETLLGGVKYWLTTNCSPRDNRSAGLNAGGQPLAVINVDSSLAQTQTRIDAPGKAVVGDSVELTATVTPWPSGGTVQFRDGGVDLGAPVAVVNGVAKANRTMTTAGDHNITAYYTGSAGFMESMSGAVTINVVEPSEPEPGTGSLGSLGTPDSGRENCEQKPGFVDELETVTQLCDCNRLGTGRRLVLHRRRRNRLCCPRDQERGLHNCMPCARDGRCGKPDHVQRDARLGVTITAPTTAAPGETVTYRVQPNEMKANSGGHASRGVVHWARIKYDFDIPSGVEFVSSQLVADSAYGLGSDSATPTVTRIDDGGNPSASGTHLRISGSNRTTGNGPSSAVRSSDGIIVGANTKFRLPAVDVTVKAGAAGSEIKPSLRVSDPGSANYDDDRNALTFVQREKDVFGVNYWERYNCSPRDNRNSGLNAGGQALTTIYVSQPTTTTIQMPGSIQASTPTELVAKVDPAPVNGNVQFRVDGADVGTPVTPGADGTARLPHTFFTAGTTRVSATFQGVNGFQSSNSTEAMVTVTAAPVVKQTDTAVNVPTDAKTGVSVSLRAQVTPTPTGGTLQFKDGAADIGAPIPVGADGKATLEHAFTLAGSHAVSAYYSGATGFMPSMASAQTVTVSDPAPSDVTTSTSLAAPATAKQNVAAELSATVAPNPGGGSVQFFDGDQPIGQPVVVGVDGVARLTHAFASTGDHRITASFAGRSGFTQSASDESVVKVSAAPDDGGNGGSGSLGSLSGLFGS
ncbi:hypothetical protein GCM10020255_035190 [Rhodococcus baikonurensis]